MAALSGAQVAQLAYQVGFRGEALVQMVAIAKRESGWNPQAHRTDVDPNKMIGDRGLWQINYINDDKLIKAGIIKSRQDLLDPLMNARAAWYLSGGGTNFSPWSATAGKGWTAGGNPLAGVSLQAGRDAVAQAQASNLLGSDWTQGGQGYQGAVSPKDGTPATNVLGGTVSSTTTAVVDPPSDGEYLNDANGTVWVAYDIGGVKVAYHISGTEQVNLAGKQIRSVSAQQWDQEGLVNAGNVSEIGTVGAKFGSFGAYWNALTIQLFGNNNPAKDDPSVKRVLAMFAGRPDMSEAELKNRLADTDWYQHHTQAQLNWNGLGDAEKQQQREAAAAQIAQTWFQLTGENYPPTDPEFVQWADDIASGKTTMASWQETVAKPRAAGIAGSPWSKQLKQPGIDLENTALNIRGQLRTWGLNWSEASIQQWAKDIVNKDKSDDDLMTAVKDQAKVLYPWKDYDTDTTTAASPWTETFKRVMEKDATLTDPTVQKALTSGQQPWAFEQDLKKSGDWLTTKNARDSLTSMAGSVGRLMGFT